MFLVWSVLQSLNAATPTLTHLFPAGGKQGATFPVTLAGKNLEDHCRVWVSGEGVSISPPDSKGKATATISPDAMPGLRLLRVFNTEGASAVRWFSVGVLPEATEAEPDDEVADGQKIERLPVCVNGVLEKAGDVDGFAVQLEAGRTIVASAEAYALGSPVDAVLTLFDGQGTRIAAAHDGRNLDPVLAHKVEKAGRYTIQISGFDHPPRADVRFTGGASVVYRLSLTADAVVTHLSPAAVALGMKSPVELRGYNLDKVDPSFEIDGAKLAVGEAVQLVQLPKWSIGPFQVVASSSVPLVEKEPNNASADAVIVGLPCTAGGTIDKPGDVDRFAFQAKKGERLIARVRSKELGLPLDAALRIESSDGKTLASNDDQGELPDPMATFSAPADGTCQAVVSDLFNKGGEHHDYVIEIGAERPDFEVTLTSDTMIVLAAGKSAEMKAKVKRAGGLAGALVACVEGLPDGVLAETVAVDEKKNEARLALTAAASAPAWSGPVRLAVFAKDAKPLMHRTARFELRGENKRGTTMLDTGDAVWLTVTPAKPEAAQKVPLPVIGAVPK